MNIDLDAIEKAARHASAPPWREYKSPLGANSLGAILSDDDGSFEAGEGQSRPEGFVVAEWLAQRDIHFLLAVQPDVVLELCRRARATGYQAVQP